jgi:hypothetical protein
MGILTAVVIFKYMERAGRNGWNKILFMLDDV